MPRTVVITPNVRQRLRRYIYNITINPSVAPKFKVETFRRAIDKANDILNDLYYTLSNEFVQYKITQFNVLGRRYGYRQYQYKDKSSKTVWLFGCDTTPFFNFVMIMQNSRLCLSHIERQGNLITENKQYNNMNNTRNKVRLTESQLHNVIKESVRRILMESDYHNAYKRGKNLDLVHSTDGTYVDSDIFECLAELKEKLRQAEERAKMPNYGDEGKTRNYLVGAIRGLQAFIDSRA